MSVLLPSHAGVARRAAPRVAADRAGPASPLAACFTGLRAAPECFSPARASLSDAVRLTTARAGVSGAATRRRVTMMPIGVPRVPYRTPAENSWQWVDIWNCLYRERIIFISSAINEELGNQLIGTMLFLDSVNVKDVNLYINSLGGDIVPTLALHDTMKHMRSDVGTVGFGGAQAMAGFLLAAGKKGKRCCLPNTHIMLHQPSGTARGQASDINNEARELMRLRAYLCKTLGEATGHSAEQTFKDISRDKYFTPDQAVEYGIIDRVLYPRRTKVPM